MTDRSWYYTVRFRTPDPDAAWPATFVLVTGWATTGERWSEGENLAANARLADELTARGVWHVPVTGYAPATGHAEPGFAVAITPEEGTALGRRYRQDAIYVVRDGVLTVRYCADEREEGVAGRWEELIDR